jgi:hypothetical protein
VHLLSYLRWSNCCLFNCFFWASLCSLSEIPLFSFYFPICSVFALTVAEPESLPLLVPFLLVSSLYWFIAYCSTNADILFVSVWADCCCSAGNCPPSPVPYNRLNVPYAYKLLLWLLHTFLPSITVLSIFSPLTPPFTYIIFPFSLIFYR